MKAVVYDKSNPQNRLIYQEVKTPIPGDNEVLVKIYAVSVNAADYRSMKMGIIPKNKIYGSDIAGRIEAIGKDVSKFVIGDEVVGDLSACGFGGFAEYVAVLENALTMKPSRIPFEIAAAIPMAAVTALQALRDKGNIQAGQKVLICGAGGGVGTFALQLAKYFNAEVTAVCSEKNEELTKSLGADHVINYNITDFSKSDKRYDLVLAINGSYLITAYKHILAPKGRCVIVGGALSQLIKFMLFGAFMSIGSKKMRILAAKPNVYDLEFVMKLLEEGKVKPIVDRHYPLNETAEAIGYISKGHASGKVMIVVAQVNARGINESKDMNL